MASGVSDQKIRFEIEITALITSHYILFTRIPITIDSGGAIYTDSLWQKDLELHLDYIQNLHLCCPVVPWGNHDKEWKPLRSLTKTNIYPLRMDGGWGSVIKNLLPNFLAVRRAIMKAEIAHSGGAGWAFPLSFYILILRRFCNFRWIMVVESSFWMKPKSRRASLREFVSHHVHSKLLKVCLDSADARILTQSGYVTYFRLTDDRTHVAPAVWVDENQIISLPALEERLRLTQPNPVRFAFPARLVADKGVDIILTAIDIAGVKLKQNKEDGPLPFLVDIIGNGPMRAVCEEFLQSNQSEIKVRLLDPVSYDQRFFDMLGEYSCILLANRQEEQPRIVFDAFSQGVPVIASATSGVMDVVTHNHSGLLYPSESPHDLADLMIKLANDRDLQRTLSINALAKAQGFSHQGMHAARAKFLEGVLS